jgi:surfeit locus 1 family protein
LVRRIVLFSTTVLIGLLAMSLGLWQLRRHAQRAERNRLATLGSSLPPIIGDSVMTPALLPNRTAILMGTLDESREFLLRNRLVAGVPAVMVITPLRLPGSDTALLVNRGYVPARNAVDPVTASWSERDRRVFRGVLLPLPDRGDGAPIIRNGRESWHALDLRMLRTRMPYPIADLYLLTEPDSASADHTVRGTVYPFRAELPPIDQGPHLGYALQWFGIAVAVLAFGVIFVWRGARRKSVNGER